MNAKQRKQAEKIKAAAMEGLETRQQSVAAEIERLQSLQKEQQWYEQCRTAGADADRNQLLLARLDQHHQMDRLNVELEEKRQEVLALHVKVNEREEQLKAASEKYAEYVQQETTRLKEIDHGLQVRQNLVEMANKPVKETINEILMMLELDETPESIAAHVRNKHHILVPKW